MMDIKMKIYSTEFYKFSENETEKVILMNARQGRNIKSE